MWPSKKGLGARLSYGVKGNGVSALDLGDFSSNIDFARRDDIKDLHEIDQPFTNIVEGQLPLYANPELRESLTMGSSISNIEGFIPSNMVSSLHKESDIFTSSIAHDPNFRNLFKLIQIKNINGMTPIPSVCYVGGPSGNVLNISYLDYRTLEAVKENDHHIYTRLLFPEFSKPFQITLTEQIKQIETPQILFDSLASFMIIRTNTGIYVLSCTKSIHSNPEVITDIEVETLGTIEVSQLAGFEFADVSFNPHDFTQFGIVDVKGNFCIWRITRTKRITKLTVGIHSVTNIADLSNWKRICWTKDLKRVLILTRSSMDQFNVESKELTRIITSQTWSKIRDFQQSEVEDHAFLLTSKELVWISLSGTIERLMSWKHFLDDSDPSLKLSLNKTGDNQFTCIIHSEVNPLLFVYTFELFNNKPYSIKDPYYINRGEYPGALKQALLLKLDLEMFTNDKGMVTDLTLDEQEIDGYIECNKYCLLEISSCLGVSIRIFSPEAELIIKPDNDEEDVSTKVEGSSNAKLQQLQYFDFISNIHMGAVFESLKENIPERSNSDDEAKSIQEYAYSLGEGINSGSSTLNYYSSLLDVSNKLFNSVVDVAEFDTMLEQLSEFFKSKEVPVRSLVYTTMVKRNQLFKEFGGSNISSASTTKDIYRLLKKIYLKDDTLKKINKKRHVYRAAIILATSLIKSASDKLTNQLQKEYSSKLESSSIQAKSLLEGWDTSIESTDTSIPESQATVADIQSSVPTIVLSSTQSQRRTEERDSSRHRSRLAPQSQAFAQTQGYTPSPLSQPAFGRTDTYIPASQASHARQARQSSQATQSTYPYSSQRYSSQSYSSQSRHIPSHSYSSQSYPSQTRHIPSQMYRDSSQRRKRRRGGFS
ncbi:RNA polymerase I-specific transcription initiation factor RRN6-like protein [Scheffersomyces coipomensis]|uniref:RNA polymerase I-specific transcription initiation factor RRN6-like protein n=1 Tax=Scheffersomyces coipomensis TaxID=1788519 RepID=UPI00315C721D